MKTIYLLPKARFGSKDINHHFPRYLLIKRRKEKDMWIKPKIICQECGGALGLAIMGIRMGSSHWSLWTCGKCGRRVEIKDDDTGGYELGPGETWPVRRF
jgi:hypothetical protein